MNVNKFAFIRDSFCCDYGLVSNDDEDILFVGIWDSLWNICSIDNTQDIEIEWFQSELLEILYEDR